MFKRFIAAAAAIAVLAAQGSANAQAPTDAARLADGKQQLELYGFTYGFLGHCRVRPGVYRQAVKVLLPFLVAVWGVPEDQASASIMAGVSGGAATSCQDAEGSKIAAQGSAIALLAVTETPTDHAMCLEPTGYMSATFTANRRRAQTGLDAQSVSEAGKLGPAFFTAIGGQCVGITSPGLLREVFEVYSAMGRMAPFFMPNEGGSEFYSPVATAAAPVEMQPYEDELGAYYQSGGSVRHNVVIYDCGKRDEYDCHLFVRPTGARVVLHGMTAGRADRVELRLYASPTATTPMATYVATSPRAYSPYELPPEAVAALLDRRLGATHALVSVTGVRLYAAPPAVEIYPYGSQPGLDLASLRLAYEWVFGVAR